MIYQIHYLMLPYFESKHYFRLQGLINILDNLFDSTTARRYLYSEIYIVLENKEVCNRTEDRRLFKTASEKRHHFHRSELIKI